jgi:hypothetical protein
LLTTRTACLALMATLLALAPASAQNALDATEAALLRGFESVCLEGLPDYGDAAETLAADGFEVYPYGEGEFEIFREDPEPLWGSIRPGSCSLSTDIPSLKSASAVLKERLASRFGAEPLNWFYDGAFSGWTLPFADKVLYVIVNESNEPDIARSGFSVELRDH